MVRETSKVTHQGIVIRNVEAERQVLETSFQDVSPYMQVNISVIELLVISVISVIVISVIDGCFELL